MVGRAGGIQNCRGRVICPAVAGINRPRSVKSDQAGETRKRVLRPVRERHDGVDTDHQRRRVPLRREGAALRGERVIQPTCAGRRRVAGRTEPAALRGAYVAPQRPVVQAANSGLLGAERVVDAHGLLDPAGGSHVKRVGVRRHVHDKTEVIGRISQVRDRRRRCISSAVASIDVAGGVEARDTGEAGEHRLWTVRQPHPRIYAAAEWGRIHLRGEGAALGRDEGKALPDWASG